MTGRYCLPAVSPSGPSLAPSTRRTASVPMRCLRMSTSSRTHSEALFVIPPAQGFAGCASDRRLRSSRKGSAFALPPPKLSPATLHPERFNLCTVVPFSFCSSTHGATVLLVSPKKSLKILSSGRTVLPTLSLEISSRAPSPCRAFCRSGIRKSSSRWRSL